MRPHPRRVRPVRLGRPADDGRQSVALLAGMARGLAAGLRRTLHAEVHAAFLDPRVIEPPAVGALLESCVVLGWSGERGDLCVVIDVPSAQACVAAALGSSEPPRGGQLSPVEHEVLQAVVAAGLPALRPLCGEIRGEAQLRPAAGDLFVEFTIGPQPAASLGVVLPARAPVLPGEPLEVESLAEVPMTLSVEFARGSLTLGELATLSCGDVIVLDTKVGAPAVLNLGGAAAFVGQSGIRAGRAAFVVRETWV